MYIGKFISNVHKSINLEPSIFIPAPVTTYELRNYIEHHPMTVE